MSEDENTTDPTNDPSASSEGESPESGGTASGSGDSSSSGSGSSAPDDLDERIRKVLREELGRLRRSPGGPTRRVDIEKQTEELVREAAKKLEEQNDEKLSKKVEELKKEIEQAPVKLSRLTRFLWGESNE